MSNLEQIVRPSVSGDIRPAFAVGLQATPAAPAPQPVTWGGSGANIFALRAHLQQTVEPAKWPDETESQRTFDVVRVKNPDDLSQHVDVEVMTKYQARNLIDKSRITLSYAKMDPTEGTIEIISTGNIRKSSTP